MTTAQSEATNGDGENGLEDHIQALPQELQDTILDFTLIAAIEGVHAIIDDPPPWQISINSRTRKIVAPKFYGTASFVVPERVVHARASPHLHLLTQWLKKVPLHYQSSIREIRVLSLMPPRPMSLEEKVALYREHMVTIKSMSFVIGRRGFDLDAKVIKMPCYSSDKDLTALAWLSYYDIDWVIIRLLSNIEDNSDSELDSEDGDQDEDDGEEEKEEGKENDSKEKDDGDYEATDEEEHQACDRH